MAADARIKADTVDDLLRIQPLALGVCIQLVEIGDPQRQIRVGEQLDGLRLGEAHEQRINVFLDGALLQQRRELVRGLRQARVAQIRAHNDAARVQIVVKRLALAQELRAEDDVLAAELLTRACSVANRNGRLNDHDGIRVVLHNQLDHSLDRARIEALRVAVVVCRSRYNNKVRIRVRSLCIQRCSQIQFFLCEILLDVFILNRRFSVVNHLNLFRHDVNRRHLMLLAQQRRDRQPHIARSRNRNFPFFHASYSLQRPFGIFSSHSNGKSPRLPLCLASGFHIKSAWFLPSTHYG